MTEWAPPDEGRSSAKRYVRPKDWAEYSEGGKKLKKFRFRVLTSVLKCWVGWPEGGRQPLRAETQNGFPAGTTWRKSQYKDEKSGEAKYDVPKEAWLFAVWDPEQSAVKVWELDQFSLMKAFRSVTQEWGSPFEYDLVAKQIQGTPIAYELVVHPSGKTPLDAQAREAWAQLQADGFDLRKMLTGGDPFPSAAAGGGGGAGARSDDGVPF